MNTLAFATITELKALLAEKKISSTELLHYFLNRFQTYDPTIKAALELFDADSIIQHTASSGSLHAIPGLIKDNISQKDRLLTCGSSILKDFRAVHDATAIARLKEQGAFIVGRANMDEFAMGSSTETSAFFKTKNPWDHTRVPGGSSGGSAAAVSAGLVPWALGTDTGGSVRQPAGLCGIVGLKPTYGLISRYGVVAYGSSLDQIGIHTRSVYDAAHILSVIAGHDEHDATSKPESQKDYTKALTRTMPTEITIGIIEDALTAQGMDAQVVEAIEHAIAVLQKCGARIKRVQLPELAYSAAAYFIISRAEAASNLARFDGIRYGLRASDSAALADLYTNTRHDGFGTEVKTRILVGNYVLSAGHAQAYYDQAKAVQRKIQEGFTRLFHDVNCIMMPTQPAPAFQFGAYDVDKLQMDLQDYFTCPANLAGIPAISVPCGLTKQNLPLGMQLYGPALSEQLLLQVAYTYEQATEWHMMHPGGFE